MNHLHKRVIITGIVAAVLVAIAYALLGVGFAVIVAIGLFVLGALGLVALIVFEEETRLPWWKDTDEPGHDHGYPAR